MFLCTFIIIYTYVYLYWIHFIYYIWSIASWNDKQLIQLWLLVSPPIDNLELSFSKNMSSSCNNNDLRKYDADCPIVSAVAYEEACVYCDVERSIRVLWRWTATVLLYYFKLFWLWIWNIIRLLFWCFHLLKVLRL